MIRLVFGQEQEDEIAGIAAFAVRPENVTTEEIGKQIAAGEKPSQQVTEKWNARHM